MLCISKLKLRILEFGVLNTLALVDGYRQVKSGRLYRIHKSGLIVSQAEINSFVNDDPFFFSLSVLHW